MYFSVKCAWLAGYLGAVLLDDRRVSIVGSASGTPQATTR
jgi:hypothetical protein